MWNGMNEHTHTRIISHVHSSPFPHIASQSNTHTELLQCGKTDSWGSDGFDEHTHADQLGLLQTTHAWWPDWFWENMQENQLDVGNTRDMKSKHVFLSIGCCEICPTEITWLRRFFWDRDIRLSYRWESARRPRTSSRLSLDVENRYRWTSHGDCWPKMCGFFPQTNLWRFVINVRFSQLTHEEILLNSPQL